MENIWLAKYFLRKAAMTLNFHKMMDIDRSHVLLNVAILLNHSSLVATVIFLLKGNGAPLTTD